jgi:hypothetical protein
LAGMSSIEIEAALSQQPEYEIVRVELAEARKQKRTGRGRIVALASTALSMVAAGGAAAGIATSCVMLSASGFSGRPVGVTVAVTSLWNQLVILGVPIIAFAGLAAEGGRMGSSARAVTACSCALCE